MKLVALYQDLISKISLANFKNSLKKILSSSEENLWKILRKYMPNIKKSSLVEKKPWKFEYVMISACI